FLISLAIELIGKAYYLKHSRDPKEAIYKHDVLSLCNGVPLDSKQQALMMFAESNVIWAGRYPTPKWTKEDFKKGYDVPCKIVDGVEHIEAEHFKNSASPQRVRELYNLYSYLRNAWQNDT
ncbi:MAG: hypothetical protein KAI17_24995, partial [Thiotrichaceae bacterium]|nr:hypothetical protein [Thiotrichaceae bacterium]